jgi:phage repressor protein C with HTH and peptisase S24 domain
MSMLTHAQIWTALDRLAARAQLSPSGLAKRAGLDPTTFNKSKRITPDGRARWPSTESLAKALAATGVSIDSFVTLIDEGAKPAQSLPMLNLSQLSGTHFDENGFPNREGWDETAFPPLNDEHAYAIEIAGDGLQPTYHEGEVIVVSPAAPVRRGDRVVVKTTNGDLMISEVTRQSAKSVDLKSISSDNTERTLSLDEIRWIARIVWASQ